MTKSYFLIFTTVFAMTTLSFGQNQRLEFTENFFDARNRWVAFDTRTGSSIYAVGFVYIDPQAGFTIRFVSMFQSTNEGFQLIPEEENRVVIHRLGRNTANVAILSDEVIEQLGLPKVPDWLHFFEFRDAGNAYYVQVGSLYNAAGASHRALEYLLRVYEQEPHFAGLEFELAFAYNATRQFDKALNVLNKAIENDPENFWFYRELGFALIHLNQPEEAEKAYLMGMKLTTDYSQKAEMAFNMTSTFFQMRNRSKFEEWVRLARQYADANSPFHQLINFFEENWEE